MRAREIRESLGMTQTELAEKLGKKQGHVSDFEQGKTNPSYSTIQQYAAALGVEVVDLFSDLAEHEREMLRILRGMPEDEQKAFVRALSISEAAKAERESV